MLGAKTVGSQWGPAGKSGIQIWETLESVLPEQNLCSKIVPNPVEILLI